MNKVAMKLQDALKASLDVVLTASVRLQMTILVVVLELLQSHRSPVVLSLFTVVALMVKWLPLGQTEKVVVAFFMWIATQQHSDVVLTKRPSRLDLTTKVAPLDVKIPNMDAARMVKLLQKDKTMRVVKRKSSSASAGRLFMDVAPMERLLQRDPTFLVVILRDLSHSAISLPMVVVLMVKMWPLDLILKDAQKKDPMN